MIPLPTVGLLYSSMEFLDFVNNGNLKAGDFENLSGKFHLAKPADIYAICLGCSWITIDEIGYCKLTERGCFLVQLQVYQVQLREQLFDCITVIRPAWSSRYKYGRREGFLASPTRVKQILKEAELLESHEEEIILWWDLAGIELRHSKAWELKQIGRKAERLSLAFEKKRTGIEPEWIGFESDFVGYDIKSVVTKKKSKVLRIEVKGSTQNKNQAEFFITRNEWINALNSENFIFHLWLINSNPTTPIIVSINQISPHIPDDREKGQWQNVKIPFGVF